MPPESDHIRAGSVIQQLSLQLGSAVDPAVQLDETSAPLEQATAGSSTDSGSSGVLARLESRPHVSRRYRLEGEIARGGMGAILEVWDEDLRRRLAMKVAHTGGDGERPSAAADMDPRLLSRFLEEAQVTGQLEHPGIVPVHELGIDENGVVFFTMQRVRGRDLEAVYQLVSEGTDGWSVTRALGVLLKVCEAMAYAHSKGVIHRDLKPANVMVGHFGEVYVMDWGLVRVRGRDDRHDLPSVEDAAARDDDSVHTDTRTDATGQSSNALYTMDGDVLGTPAYMSPEQGRGAVDDLDERSDVYSLGCMLYSLLAGVAPYERKGAERPNALETLNGLREGPPPTLAELAPDAPAELIAVTEKAMARDPVERYPDMLGLADDLRAFLENRVVGAYRTGAVAEARKWVRRNRSLAASLAAGLLTLVAGLVASLVLKAQSDANAERAGRQASIAREVANFMNDDLFAAIAPEQEGIDVTVREVLAIASARLDGRFDKEPLVEAELRRTIGTSFERLGEFETAGEHLERAHELMLAEHGAQSEPALSTGLLVGSIWSDLGRFEEALELYGQTIEVCEAEFGTYHAMTLEARSGVAHTLQAKGELDAAVQQFAELEAVLRRELGDQHELTLAMLTRYASALYDSGRLEEAETLQVEALDVYRASVGEGHPLTLGAADALGETLVGRGRTAEAEALLLATQEKRESVLGPDHPATANGLSRLGTHYYVQGRAEEAERYFSRGFETLRRTLGSEHRFTLQMANNVAAALSGLGRDDESLELREATLAAQRRTLGDEHPHTIVSLSNLATALLSLERYDEAEVVSREITEVSKRVLGADHPDTLIATENLSGILLFQERFAESIALTESVLAARKRTLGPEHRAVARTLFNLGAAADAMGDTVVARARFEEAIAVGTAAEAVDVVTNAMAELAGLKRSAGDVVGAMEGYAEAAAARREFGIDDPFVESWLYAAGNCAYTLEDFDEAARLFGETLAMRVELYGREHDSTQGVMVGLYRSLMAAERYAEAEPHALEIHALVLAKEGEGSDRVGRARQLIVQLYEAWDRPEEAERWR